MERRKLASLVLLVACGGNSGDAPGDGSNGGNGGDGGGGGGSALSDKYPGDVGLGDDPAVVWLEDFELASVAAVSARYDQVQGASRMQLVSDKIGGAQAMAMTAGQGVAAVDLFKRLSDHEELYWRWYVKYEANADWHHSGVWVGGYNPPMDYPSPGAGTRPNGDDRFSISVEPVFEGANGPRFDFYNYWMTMRSWMETPTNDGTSYYGNSAIHRNDFTIDEDQWVCLEVHAKLNPDGASGAGAVLEVWKNDTRVARFDDAGPLGYWVRDKFCPMGSDGTECTDFPDAFDEKLDLRFRSTTQLKLNVFWPQNYISTNTMGTLTFDQMVVATERVGCMR